MIRMMGDRALRRLAVTVLVALTVCRFSPATAAEAPAEFAVQFRGAVAPVRVRVAVADADAALAALTAMPEVRFAEPLATYRAALVPNDPLFANQWYLPKIGAPTAWDRTVGSPSAIVAVLDTGVDITHPDLRENVWRNPREIADGSDNDGNGLVDDLNGWNFYDGNNNVRPAFEAFTSSGIHHGTLIAGEIGAQGGNAQGIAGVNWRVSVMALRVLSSSGIGDVVHVVEGMNYAIANGADVISLSFSGPNRSAILDDAIRRANDAGILVVAAAGNDLSMSGGVDLDATPMYPACSDGPGGENWVLGVAATDESDHKAVFSDFGAKCIDLSAPGVRIFSTLVRDDAQPGFGESYGGYYNGTSLAAPLVAGAAALVRAANPNVTLPQLRDLLLTSADGIDPANPSYVGKLGRGRLNVGRAMALQPAPNPPAPATIEPLPPQPEREALQALVISYGRGLLPLVSLRRVDGSPISTFPAYAERFLGGVTAQFGDVDGDGVGEIVTVPGPSGGPHVRVFSFAGDLESEFFAYESTFTGGLSLALADTDGDGVSEIIVAPLAGRTPEVRVFTASGARKASFLAYDGAFRGGVRVAAGDTDLDGRAEIVTAPASSGGAHIRTFSGSGTPIVSFFAADPALRSGFLVAMGDPNGDARADIAVLDVTGNVIHFFTPYRTFVGEIEIDAYGTGFPFALGDVNGDGHADLMLGIRPATRQVIRSYDVTGPLIRETPIASGTAPGEIRVAPAVGFSL